MGKAPSIETQLRTAKSRIKELERSLSEAEKQRLAYRTRATQAEQESAQWKQRFDILLLITKDGPKATPKDGVKEDLNG